MGKCLSCCKAHHTPQSDASKQFKSHQSGLQAVKTSSSLRSDSKTSVSAVIVTSVLEHTNNKSSLGSVQSMSCEKQRMFHPRIPSISKSVTSYSSKESFSCLESKINQLFDRYKDPDSDNINPEGIEKFCYDLDVKPDDFRILLVAWKFKAETMCQFSRQEFINGCKNLKVDSIKGIQNRFPDLVQETNSDPDLFKDLYRFTFRFGLEDGQRSLPTEMSVVLWKLVFSQQEPAMLKRWIDFLQDHPNVRYILRDTWNMFLNFVRTVGDDLGSYDDTEAWPSLFDDFVEYENDQMNQNIPEKDKEDIL